jgi:hypothetical protein
MQTTPTELAAAFAVNGLAAESNELTAEANLLAPRLSPLLRRYRILDDRSMWQI